MIDHLGSLKGFTIAEIGAGYGGQAKIITDVFKVQKYFLIDLPEVTLLQDRYIKELKIPFNEPINAIEMLARIEKLFVNYRIMLLDEEGGIRV